MSTKGNARSSGYEIAQGEWYVESRRAIDALLDAEKFRGQIHDPACGGGNIPKACIDRGYPATGSDIADRGYGETGKDFMDLGYRPHMGNCITNPPFSLAAAFVLRALDLRAKKVAVLQRTAWLESEKRYQTLFKLGYLRHIWQFRSRISMPPGGKDVEAKNGSVAYAWFVFDQDKRDFPTLGWLP